MTTIKTSELTGAALDWAVAKAEGYTGVALESRTGEWYTPSTYWAQGGPIIEREGICLATLTKQDLCMKPEHYWVAHIDGVYCRYSPTPLIAAMRCYVASKLGDTVEVPDELVQTS